MRRLPSRKRAAGLACAPPPPPSFRGAPSWARAMMRNCASENPLGHRDCCAMDSGLDASRRPGMTGSVLPAHTTVLQHEAGPTRLADSIAQIIRLVARVRAYPDLVERVR